MIFFFLLFLSPNQSYNSNIISCMFSLFGVEIGLQSVRPCFSFRSQAYFCWDKNNPSLVFSTLSPRKYFSTTTSFIWKCSNKLPLILGTYFSSFSMVIRSYTYTRIITLLLSRSLKNKLKFVDVTKYPFCTKKCTFFLQCS